MTFDNGNGIASRGPSRYRKRGGPISAHAPSEPIIPERKAKKVKRGVGIRKWRDYDKRTGRPKKR